MTQEVARHPLKEVMRDILFGFTKELPHDETLILPHQTLLTLYSSSSSNWSAWER